MNRCGAKKIDLTTLLRLAAALSVAPVAVSAPALEPDQVLIVYNSLDEDSEAIQKYYREARPGVAGLDLRNREILGRHTISYPTFRRAIRQPIRDFLRKEPGRAVSFLCIVLTKGIPHRLDDMNHRGIGDNPEQEKVEWLAKGDLTAASVDSELTLLWQNLEQFEEGRPFDSRADGFIVNPFYGQIKPFAEFDRRFVASPKRFIDISQVVIGTVAYQAGWEAVTPRLVSERLRPGDLYLVTRLDGRSRQDVFASIDRAQNIEIDPSQCLIILDANARGGLDRADYQRTSVLLRKAGWNVLYDSTEEFITGDELDRPVLAYASYGKNDWGGDEPESTDYIASFDFVPGAIFNTLESFNGRDFGGAGDRPNAGKVQTQLSDFIAAGGTLGIGNVWEPFSFAAADNELLLDAFLNRGWTFAEAAYSSLMVLSWQQIVVGDPLARVTVIRPRVPWLKAVPVRPAN